MRSASVETPAQLVRRLTSGELASLRDNVAAGRPEIGLKGLDERGAASEIVRDQYAGRYPLELLQNANDAAASEGAAGGRAKFVLTESALLVADEGAGFGTDQVRAICGLARSSKDPRKSVGYKGLGFKSVREITDTPQVISGELMFCFDAGRLRSEVESILGEALPDGARLPDYAFPFELSEVELGPDRGVVDGLLAEGFKTIMRLPFRHGDIRRVVEQHLMDSVVPRLLLFLDATESLELAGTQADFTAVAARKQFDSHQELLLEARDRIEHLLVFRRQVAIEDRTLVDGLGGAWSEVEAVRLAVAVPLGADGTPVGGASEPLHVYFPTEEQTGVSLILNGDFQMELDRRRISRTLQAEEYNRWLRDQLARFVAWTVVPALAKRFEGIGVLDVLASYGDGSGWGEDLMQHVFDALATQEFVPCSDSKLRRPSESRLLPPTVPDPVTVGPWLTDHPSVVVPAAEASAPVRLLLANRLKVPVLTLGPVLASLSPSAETDAEAFYHFILQWSFRASRGFELLLSSARCVLLPGGQWVKPLDGAVFLPPQRGESNFPVELELPIAQLPEIDGLTKLLEDAGVKPLTWRVLVASFLMPRLSDPDADEERYGLALNALRTYFGQVRRSDAGDQEIRDEVSNTMLPARSVNGETLTWAKSSELYFADSWPLAGKMEILYGPFGEPDFLDVEPGGDAAAEFEFYQWLGVADSPRVVEVEDWASDYSAWRRSKDYRDASSCLSGNGAHPMKQSLTSKPSIDRLPRLIESGDLSQLAALWLVLSTRWGAYRPRLRHAKWRCSASAMHKVERDRWFISPALFMLRTTAWVPATRRGIDSVAKPGNLWRSTQGMHRSISEFLSVPSSSLGRVPADFAEDMGLLDIATASSTNLIDIVVELEAGDGTEATPKSLEAAQWILRRLEDSEWKISPEPGSVPLIARLDGRLIFDRHPVIANNPKLVDIWGDTLPIYGGDRDLFRLLNALGIQFLDDQVQIETVVGGRQSDLENKITGHLEDVAAELIALATQDVPSRRPEIAMRLKRLTVVCSDQLVLRYTLDGYQPRIDESADAHIDRDGVLYIRTEGLEPDWSSLALRLADYLDVETGDGFAFVLTADSRTRAEFLRARGISGVALDAAGEAFDAKPGVDDIEPIDDTSYAVRPSDPQKTPEEDEAGNPVAHTHALDADGQLDSVRSGEPDVNTSLAVDRAASPDESSASGIDRVLRSSIGSSLARSWPIDNAGSGQGASSSIGSVPRPSAAAINNPTPDAEVNESRFVSYVVARGSREARMAERADSEAMRIGSLGVDRVIAYEAQFGRNAVSQDHSNKGFDVISVRADGTDRRVIEVKATSAAWPSRGIPVSRHQIDKNVQSGDEFWLYVVEFAVDPEQARVIPIQNPVAGVDYFVFDPGWEHRAADAGSDVL